MKKLFRKRSFALLLDGFIFGCFYTIFIKKYVDIIQPYLGSITYFLIFVPYFFKDFALRNTSIGKFVFGLIVLDDKWLKPRFWTLLKRSLVVQTAGFIIYRTLKLRNKDKLWFVNWELKLLNTRVVERKVYKQLKKAATINGVFSVEAMNKLYEEYLQNGNIIDSSTLKQMEHAQIKYEE